MSHLKASAHILESIWQNRLSFLAQILSRRCQMTCARYTSAQISGQPFFFVVVTSSSSLASLQTLYDLAMAAFRRKDGVVSSKRIRKQTCAVEPVGHAEKRLHNHDLWPQNV